VNYPGGKGMYEYIRGKLAAKDLNYIIIDNNGIGYRIYTSTFTQADLPGEGQEVMVYTYLYLREGIMDLYGFSGKDELAVFEMLLTVSGIGPKAAVALLSAVSPTQFILAVLNDDINALTKAPGVGKKLAQKIILELKDKLKKEQLVKEPVSEGTPHTDDNLFQEAVRALMALGYTAMEANKAVASVFSRDMQLEDIIRNSLRAMAAGR